MKTLHGLLVICFMGFLQLNAQMDEMTTLEPGSMKAMELTRNERKLAQFKARRDILREDLSDVEEHIDKLEMAGTPPNDPKLVSLKAKRDQIKQELKDVEDQIDAIEMVIGTGK